MDASLLIIGAGPAGLWAALTAAQRIPPERILVLDRMAEAGAKLAVTGGGRGNISHVAIEEEFFSAFGRQGRFTMPAFRTLSPGMLRYALARMGIPSDIDVDGRIYPLSQSARQVRDVLYAAATDAGIRFRFQHRVSRLVPPARPGHFLDEAVLGQRTQVERAVGGALPHQFAGLGGGQRPLPAERFEQ